MLREFTDVAGKTWQVWDVYPTTRGKSDAPGGEQSQVAFPNRDLGEGWLCFQCAAEKRRLAPIPADWEVCDCSKLEQWCKRAGYISLAKPTDGNATS